MHRVALSEWRQKFWSGKCPHSVGWLKQQIEAGRLAGGRVGNTSAYVVHCEADYTPVEECTTGNKLADAILKQHGKQ